MNNLLLRRRALMRMGGKKEEYALTKKDQPNILAAFYNAGLCASPNYMTIEEASAITNNQLGTVTFKNADFNGEDFSGFKYFTSVTQITAGQFKECNISKITLPISVTSLSNTAFINSSITNIVVPDSVTNMSNFVFNECEALVEAVIGNNVPKLDTATFRFCIALKKVTIGSSITSIGSVCFQRCRNLKSLIFNSDVPPTISSDAFNEISTLPTFYCPDDAVSTYQTAFPNNTVLGISDYTDTV